MSVKRAIVIALLFVLGANACRRIVDLTPVARDAVDGDAELGPDALTAAFDASVGSD